MAVLALYRKSRAIPRSCRGDIRHAFPGAAAVLKMLSIEDDLSKFGAVIAHCQHRARRLPYLNLRYASGNSGHSEFRSSVKISTAIDAIEMAC